MSESTSTPIHTCLASHDQWGVGGLGGGGVWFMRKHGEEDGSYSTLSSHSPQVVPELHRLANGGVFIDYSQLIDEKRQDLVIKGPMLHRGRGDFHETKPLDEAGPLHYVSLGDYIELYSRAGARIGVRQENLMVWWQGIRIVAKEEIAPCTCWHHVCLSCHRLRYYVDRQYKSSGECVSRMPSDPNDHCPECKGKME